MYGPTWSKDRGSSVAIESTNHPFEPPRTVVDIILACGWADPVIFMQIFRRRMQSMLGNFDCRRQLKSNFTQLAKENRDSSIGLVLLIASLSIVAAELR